MSQILMADGPLVDLKRPRRIRVERCVETLSRMCRYGGNIPSDSPIVVYSVAEHSVLVSRLVEYWGFSLKEQAAGLLHDIHESLMGDVITPVKRWLGGDIGVKEDRLSRQVLEELWGPGLDTGTNAVKFADLAALVLEVRALGIPEDVFFQTGAPPIPYELPSLSHVRNSWGLLQPNGHMTLRGHVLFNAKRFMARFEALRAAIPRAVVDLEPACTQLSLFDAEA
jgi:hypothetical protein